MKHSAMYLAVIALAAAAVPVRLPAQPSNSPHSRYLPIDLGTLGGSGSIVCSPGCTILNNQGVIAVAGDTSIPDPFAPNCFQQECLVQHAFLWRAGVRTDLGTLAGGAGSFPTGINEAGLTIGVAENGLIDPSSGLPNVVAVLWRHGGIANLGTLGGAQSVANAINDRAQVVGGALNMAPDPFSAAFAPLYYFAPAVTQSHAFLWQNGVMQDLGTLGGPDSIALFVNERGQVAGYSLTNSSPTGTTGMPTTAPFLWDDGHMVNLGSLGGTLGFPNALNNRGQVVGQSNLAGDKVYHPFLWDGEEMKDLGTLGGNLGFATWINDAGDVVGRADVLPTAIDHHAFLWRHGKMADLGTLAGAGCSTAYSINSRAQVVGSAGICGTGGRAFLWENGEPIVDLQTLVLPGSNVKVTDAIFINERGQIAGLGTLPNGDVHAVLLVPVGRD